MDRVFQAKKEAGKFVWLDQSLMAEYIQSLQDGLYGLVIKNQYKGRSNQQNRYLFGVVYKLIADETGHTPEEIHEHMRWRFLRKYGGKLETVRSTTSLSTRDYSPHRRAASAW